MSVTEQLIAEVCNADRQALLLRYKASYKGKVFTSESVTIGTLVMLDKVRDKTNG